MTDLKATFTGSIPEYYDSCLGPAYFDPYAKNLAQRLPAKPAGPVLEIACGTGLVTRRLRERLDPSLRLVATDLSKAMLDYAHGKLREARNIDWREADAMKLPFGDGEFAAVVCAFGFMFVPSREAALKEARRVLRKGGTLLFSVWDRMEENTHALANADVVEALFPGDAEMRFPVPYEMADAALLRRLLAGAQFRETRIETASIPVDKVSARTVATGAIRGTPRSLLFEKRGVPLERVIELVTEALVKRGGADPFRGRSQAIMVEAVAV